MLEWYEAYADYQDIAARLEELSPTWPTEVGYDGPDRLLAAVAAHHPARRDPGEDRHRHRRPTTSCPGEGTWAKRVDDLLSKHVEPDLANPTFILDYPKELSPFAKDHRSEPGWSSASSASPPAWSSPTPSRS